MKKLLLVGLLQLVAIVGLAQQTFYTPTIFDKGSSLTIKSGVPLSGTWKFGNSAVDFTGTTVTGLSVTASSIPWGGITGSLTSQVDLTSALSGKQPIDDDLTALSTLTGTNTIYYRSSAGVWSPVTIGSNMTFTAGTLNSTAAGGGGGGTWGSITGTISNQSDLMTLISARQPLDADLSAIAALTTTSFGRGALALADAASFRTYIGAGSTGFDGTFAGLLSKPTTLAGYGITDAQPLNVSLTSISALAGQTGFGQGFLTQANAAAARTYIGAGTSSFDGTWTSLTAKPTTLVGFGITDAQPLDTDLTAIAGVVTQSFGRGALAMVDAASFRSYIGAGAGGGDLSSNTALSVDGEVALFNLTSGKSIKRATGSGIATLTSGVLGSITDNSANWNTAFTDRMKWDGGATGLTAATGRTSLGATVTGSNFFTLGDAGAIGFPKITATNTVVSEPAATYLTDLGGTTAGQSFFTLTNPSAVTFPRINANNTVTAQTAVNYRLDLGATTAGVNLFTLATPAATSWLEVSAAGAVTTVNAATTRTDLGLVIGTNVQAWDADLDALGALTGTNTIYYRSGAAAWSPVTFGGNLSFSGGILNAIGSGSGTVTTSGSPLAGNLATFSAASVVTNGNLAGDVTTTGTLTTTLTNIPTGVTQAGYVDHTTIATPAVPTVGKLRVYGDTATGTLAVEASGGGITHTVKTSTPAPTFYTTGITADGSVTTAQPAFTDVSGTTTNAQLPTTLSSKTLDNSNTYTAKDGSFTIQNTTDTTKHSVFDLSQIGTGLTRTVTIPNANSVTVQPNTGTANNYVFGITSAGVVQTSQPAFSNLSGSVAASQMPALTGDVTSSAGTTTTTVTNVSGSALPAFTGDVTKPSGSTVTTLGNISSGVTAGGYIGFTAMVAPASPAPGGGRFYVDSTSKNMSMKNDAGVVVHGIQSTTATASNYITGVADNGTITRAQPAFSDISGAVNLATQTTGSLPSTSVTGSIPTTQLSGTVTSAQMPAFSGDVTTTAGSTATTLTNIPSGTTQAGSLLATAIAAPLTPALGKGSIYVDSTSKNISMKNDAGIVVHGIQTASSSASNWVTGITDAGGLTTAQPAFSNISGQVNLATQTTGSLPASSITGSLPITQVSGVVPATQMPALSGDVTTSIGSTVTTLTNIPSGTTQAGYLSATAIAAPASPPPGLGRVYVDSTSKNFSMKNDAGVVTHGVQTSSVATSNYVTGIADSGAVTRAQPAFSDISGQVNLATQATGTLPPATMPALSGDVTTTAGSTTTTLTNIPSGTTMGGRLITTNIAQPANPATGTSYLYVDSATKNLSSKNELGVVTHGIQSRVTTANNWIDSIADDGSTTIKQPSFSNLSGNFTLAQGPSTTASVLIGRTSVGVGVPQEITLGTNLAMSGTTLNVGTNLTTWGGIAPAAGVGTFLATPSSANLRSMLTDENGTGAVLFNGATTPDFTTGFTVGGVGTAGKVPVGSGTSYAPATISGSGATITMGSTGVVTISGITKTSITGAPSGAFVGDTDMQTLTGKRINPRVTTIGSTATLSPNANTDDYYVASFNGIAITTINNPSGTPVNGQKLIIRIKDQGTPIAISGWGTQYRALSSIALPTTTIANHTLYIGFIYNDFDIRWDCVAVSDMLN